MLRETFLLALICLVQNSRIHLPLHPARSSAQQASSVTSQSTQAQSKDITGDSKLYQEALESIWKEFPWSQSYSVAQVLQSVPSGEEKEFLLKRKGGHQEAIFAVSVLPGKPPQVVLKQHLHAQRYSREQISQRLNEVRRTMPALGEHQLVEAWSPNGTNQEGSAGQLVLKLGRAGETATVHMFTYLGKGRVAVYGL